MRPLFRQLAQQHGIPFNTRRLYKLCHRAGNQYTGAARCVGGADNCGMPGLMNSGSTKALIFGDGAPSELHLVDRVTTFVRGTGLAVLLGKPPQKIDNVDHYYHLPGWKLRSYASKHSLLWRGRLSNSHDDTSVLYPSSGCAELKELNPQWSKLYQECWNYFVRLKNCRPGIDKL